MIILIDCDSDKIIIDRENGNVTTKDCKYPSYLVESLIFILDALQLEGVTLSSQDEGRISLEEEW